MNEQNNLQAQLRGVQSALEQLEAKYNEGVLDVARYLSLKAKYEADKARLEQTLAEEQRALLDNPAHVAARQRYLAALRDEYGVVQTLAFMELIRDERVGSARQLPLLGRGGVYVPLAFDPPAARRGNLRAGGLAEQEQLDEREMQPFTLADVLTLPGHLALIGDAGSGKTTLLRVIASTLAAQDPRAVAPDLAPLLPGPDFIPVLLPLRLFEHACGQERYQRTADDLLRFVDDWFSRWQPGVALPAGFLSDHVRAGRAWLLLDALDEVADPTQRQTVRNVIHKLASAFAPTRLIVTARVAGYRGARLDEERFSVAHVRDLDEEQRQRLVHAIYTGLDLDDAQARSADLIERFQEKSLRDLGRTPVMVWTAAVIHALRGQLPESRAALYDGYVDVLLRHSFKRSHFDVASVEELSGGLGWSLPERREYLSYAAFQVHRMLEDRLERRGEQPLVVSENELSDQILSGYFRDNLRMDEREALQQARRFVSVMVAHSGLLYETPEGYTIGDHHTMQEFLAACYVGRQFDRAGLDFLWQKVASSWWREVFILTAGHLAEQRAFEASDFLWRMLEQEHQTPSERLAALALAARCLLPLRLLRQQPSWYTRLAGELAGKLYNQLYAQAAHSASSPRLRSGQAGQVSTPVAARQDAGLTLGLLHGYPGQDGPGDPRFAHPGGLPDFIRVQGGEFWMGSSQEEVERLIKETGRDYFKRELPRHRVYLDGFELARFPTTNAMFARFVAAEGYKDGQWWAEAKADGYWAEGKYKDPLLDKGRAQPVFWDDARFNNPAQPVVGVSWYEAVAYCAWLTATLNDGYTYRLPSEAQWGRAARGLGGGRYPWGDEWRDDHCNSEESGLRSTSPVGIFPRGTAQGGIEDMAGNVWEWCSDWYGEDYYAQSQDARNPNGPEKGRRRIFKGGSWIDGTVYCRCGHRYGGDPWDWDDTRGFRCARIFSS